MKTLGIRMALRPARPIALRRRLMICFWLTSGISICGTAVGQQSQPPDIRAFSQHFIDESDVEPWTFLPGDNIDDISLTEHRGLVTIREAGQGRDIKGLLRDPIRIDEYAPPWEFHLGIMQNHLGQKGLSEGQINYAIGLNLAVTFSDPDNWPSDRNTASQTICARCSCLSFTWGASVRTIDRGSRPCVGRRSTWVIILRKSTCFTDAVTWRQKSTETGISPTAGLDLIRPTPERGQSEADPRTRSSAFE